MHFVYAIIMLICCVVSAFYATRIIYNKSYKNKLTQAFTITSIGSSMWSLGYGLMFMFDEEEHFIVARGVGISGLIIFLIAGQLILTMILEEESKLLLQLIRVEAYFGVIVGILVLIPDNYRVIENKGILTTEFTSKYVATIYTAYTIIVAGCFIAITLSMISKRHKKSLRVFGQYFLIVEGLILFGMIFDTILPAFGIFLNIPASTILQFVGLDIIYHAIHVMSRNILSVQNMSGYIYHSLKAPVVVFDPKHRVNLSNAEADKMFHINSSDLKSRTDFWEYIFHIAPPEGLDVQSETLSIKCYDHIRNRQCQVYIDSIYDQYSDFIGYIVMATDMTDFYNNLEALELAKQEAQAASIAKSQFLANMSHEIRTPMNSILGFSELALKENIDNTSKEYFSDINNSAKVLLNTINDILDLSKIENGKMELVEENYHLQDILKDIQLIIGMEASKKDLCFEIDYGSSIPDALIGDKTKIREILINTLNNGIKYTKEGYVKLHVKAETENNSATLFFDVEDSGMGIKEDELEHIFDSFQRADIKANAKTEGTGLGLSITKGLVELMGGSISVYSQYGKGSIFSISLTQRIADTSKAKTMDDSAEHETRKLQLRDLKILAVDDNKINLKVISKTMSLRGIQIDLAESGKEAIDMCQSTSYDLIFMDHMMPEMDGVEAMQHIRNLGGCYSKNASCSIVALTANTINGTREELLIEGFDEFLGKPIAFNQLDSLLVSILPEDKYFYID